MDTWLYSEVDGWTKWTPDIAAFNPPGRRWHVMSSLDTLGGGHAVVMFGGAGGVDKHGNPLYALDDTYVAASVALWTRLPPLPTPPQSANDVDALFHTPLRS